PRRQSRHGLQSASQAMPQERWRSRTTLSCSELPGPFLLPGSSEASLDRLLSISDDLSRKVGDWPSVSYLVRGIHCREERREGARLRANSRSCWRSRRSPP